MRSSRFLLHGVYLAGHWCCSTCGRTVPLLRAVTCRRLAAARLRPPFVQTSEAVRLSSSGFRCCPACDRVVPCFALQRVIVRRGTLQSGAFRLPMAPVTRQIFGASLRGLGALSRGRTSAATRALRHIVPVPAWCGPLFQSGRPCERASLPHRWHPEPLQSLDGRLSSVALAGSLSPTLHSAAARSLLDDQTNSCSWCFRATDAVT